MSKNNKKSEWRKQKRKMVVFSGTSNPLLAKKIANELDIKLGNIFIKRFEDGEIFVQIKENVRKAEAFIILPTCSSADAKDLYGSVDNSLIELFVIIDALKKASARGITAVIPYYGYARQDRKSAPRTPISAKLMAKLIEAAGAKRVVLMDIHSGQAQGFFDDLCDNLYARPVLIKHIKEKFKKELKAGNLLLVSPDAGGADRTRSYAKILKVGIAIIDKRRENPNESEVMHVIGDVSGKTVIMLDDMVDTAGTLCNGAEALLANGAKEVHACCSHPVLSGPAIKRITKSRIKSLIVTDSIPLKEFAQKCKKIKVVSVAKLLAKAIKNIFNGDGLEILFEKY